TAISSSWPALGLVLGLGLASFSCTGGEGGSATVADSADSREADGTTYGGPDTWDVADGNPWTTTTTTTTTANDSLDSQEADGTTYGGPDESTSIGRYWTTT